MDAACAESHNRFEIPGTAEVVPGNGGLSKVRIASPEAVGEIYLDGAHVTSWKPAGEEEVFFLSTGSCRDKAMTNPQCRYDERQDERRRL